MTYADAGVNYENLDPFKRKCQMRAKRTYQNAERFGVYGREASRGESVYLMKVDANRFGEHQMYVGHVEEGLGTKNLVADAVRKITGRSHYRQIAQDTVAMIVNDPATVGIFPASVAMHVAVGSDDWFTDEERADDLVQGWGDACDLARCIWVGGETPTLKGIIISGTVLLSGSSWGIAPKPGVMDPKNLQAGDSIILLDSSGIHANGLSSARKIAERLDEGYSWKLSDGRSFGEALLDPTHIYSGFIEDCLDAGIFIKYGVHITGHGWRKIMRADAEFTYILEKVPRPQPVFDFIQKHGPVTDREAYSTFNMGAGFALFVSSHQVRGLLDFAEKHKEKYGFGAMEAGHIVRGEKKVVIKPKGIEFTANTLAVR
ncbi:phosphoribosylformylglycinamidine cyclo-ligase [Candidatus Parcubacteria bacterium]|nr:phosphoribosylformylglycinamidine cyclo-ligase [Candidatus Parcubacteria bacterium]